MPNTDTIIPDDDTTKKIAIEVAAEISDDSMIATMPFPISEPGKSYRAITTKPHISITVAGTIADIVVKSLNSPASSWEEQLICGTAQSVVETAVATPIYTAIGTVAAMGVSTAVIAPPVGTVVSLAAGIGLAEWLQRTGVINAATEPFGHFTQNTCRNIFAYHKKPPVQYYFRQTHNYPGFEASKTPFSEEPITYLPNTHYTDLRTLAEKYNKPLDPRTQPSSDTSRSSGSLLTTMVTFYPLVKAKAQYLNDMMHATMRDFLKPEMAKIKSAQTKSNRQSPSIKGSAPRIKQMPTDRQTDNIDLASSLAKDSPAPLLSLTSKEYNDLLNTAIGENNLIRLTPAQCELIRSRLGMNDGEIAATLQPAVDYVNPETKNAVLLPNLMQSLQLISQIGAFTNNANLQRFAMIGTSVVQVGIATLAMKNAVAMAAMGGPFGVGLAFASAVISMVSVVFGGNRNNGPELSEVISYYHRELVGIIDENHSQILKNFAQQRKMDFYIHGTIINLGHEIERAFHHLHHTLTISNSKHFAKVTREIDAQFTMVNAKIDQLGLQPLLEIIYKTKPYLENSNLVLSQERYIEYMGMLSGILEQTIKNPAWTHGNYPTNQPGEIALHTHSKLSKINLKEAEISNYLGLIVASLNALDTLPKLPEEHVFNVNMWYKALGLFIELQNKFPHLNYKTAENQVGQILRETEQLQELLAEISSNKFLASLWEELTIAQDKVNNIASKIYDQFNRQFQSTHLVPDIDLLTFTIDDLSGHPELNKARVPLVPVNHNTTVKWKMYGRTGSKSVTFQDALGYPYTNSFYTHLKDHYNITIPQAFIAAEAMGLGKFEAQILGGINCYILEPNRCDNRGIQQIVDDANYPGHHGLRVVFTFKHHELAIFSPGTTNYLNRDYWNLWYDFYNTKHGSKPNYPNGREWDSFSRFIPNRAKAIVPRKETGNRECTHYLNPSHNYLDLNAEGNYLAHYADNIEANTNIITAEITTVVSDSLMNYALAVLARLKQSPEIERVYQIKQLLISIATLLGYPSELIQELYTTLHPNNELQQFELLVDAKANLRPQLNLVNNTIVTTLRDKMLAARTSSIGIIEQYLHFGSLKIKSHLMHLDQQSIAKEFAERSAKEQQEKLSQDDSPHRNRIIIDDVSVQSPTDYMMADASPLANSMSVEKNIASLVADVSLPIRDTHVEYPAHSLPELGVYSSSQLPAHARMIPDIFISKNAANGNQQTIYGAWRNDVFKNSRTGRQEFIYDLLSNGKKKGDPLVRVGSATFDGHPLLCRKGNRHNVVAADGILTGVENKIIIEQIENECQSLPATFTDRITSAAKNGTQLGMLRGFSHHLEKQLDRKGYSPVSSKLAAHACFYGMYGTMKAAEHYFQMEAEADIANVFGCLLLAAYETGNMFIINIVLIAVNYLMLQVSQLLEQKQWQTASAFVKKSGYLLHFGIFAAQAIHQPIEEVGASLLVGSAVELGVEKVLELSSSRHS